VVAFQIPTTEDTEFHREKNTEANKKGSSKAALLNAITPL
jgi:hypothetical protein